MRRIRARHARRVVEDFASLRAVDPGVQFESAALLASLTAHETAQVVELRASQEVLMVMFKAGSSCVFSLATILVLVSPPPIEAQESEDGLSWSEIGLVGLTVDMPDEQVLG
jgi:hypothetical protein